MLNFGKILNKLNTCQTGNNIPKGRCEFYVDNAIPDMYMLIGDVCRDGPIWRG